MDMKGITCYCVSHNWGMHMIKCRLITLIFGVVFLFTSCASTYRVEVTGYENPAYTNALLPGKTISIVLNPQAANPLLEKEVAFNIARLLRKEGYQVLEEEGTDFRLTFNYGMDRGPVLTDSVRRPRRIDIYDPDTGKTHYTTVDTYQPYSVQSFTRFLSIRVQDVRGTDSIEKTQVVWAADTVSEGTSSDLREALSYLLVATFRFFGKDTGKAVTVTLNRDDLQVRRLNER